MKSDYDMDKLLRILKPLFDSTNISYFSYLIGDLEKGLNSMVSTRPDYIVKRKKEKYPVAITFLPEGYYWWNDIIPKASLEGYRDFNIDNLFMIVKNRPDLGYIEDYCLGTDTSFSQLQMINFYFNNLDLLDDFINYFREEAKDIIEVAIANMEATAMNLEDIKAIDPTFHLRGSNKKLQVEQDFAIGKQNLPILKHDVPIVGEDQKSAKSLFEEKIQQVDKETRHKGVSLFRKILMMGMGSNDLTVDMIEREPPVDQQKDLIDILKGVKTPLCMIIANMSSIEGKMNTKLGIFDSIQDSFFKENEFQLQANQTGSQASQFLRQAKSMFNGKFEFEQINQNLINLLYEAVLKLNQDLEQDERWVDFLEKIKHLMLSHSKFKEDIDQHLSVLKQNILHKYRQAIIRLTTYQANQKLSSFEAKNYNRVYHLILTQVNQSLLEGLSVKQCLKKIHNDIYYSFKNKLSKAEQTFHEMVYEGNLSNKVSKQLELIKENIKSSAEYKILDKKATDDLLRHFTNHTKAYSNLTDLINKEIKAMVELSVPNADADAENSFEHLAKQAANHILNSPEMKAMPKLGSTIVKNQMLSDKSMTYIAQLIVNKRLKYFRNLIDVDISLLFSKEVGLNWMSYRKGAIDVISALYDQYFVDSHSGAISANLSKEKKEQLLQALQSIYLDSYYTIALETIESGEPFDVNGLIQELESTDLIKDAKKIGFKGLGRAQIQEKLDSIRNIKADQHEGSQFKKSNGMDSFYIKASPELCLTVGVVKELEHANNQNKSTKLNESQYLQLFKANHNKKDSLVQLLSTKHTQPEFKNKIEEIEDLEQRFLKIKEYFQMATSNSIFVDSSYLAEDSDEGQVTPYQRAALELLQDLYMKTLDLMWRQLASKNQPGVNHNTGLPALLSADVKTTIYYDVLKPELDSEIINCELLPNRKEALLEAIFAMQEELVNLPES